MSGNYRYTGEQPPEFLNLAQYCLEKSAQLYPDKIALIAAIAPQKSDDDQSWTYAELEAIVLRGAKGLLSCGFKPGDRVLIRLDNTPHYAFLFLAACAAGLIPIPSSAQLSAREIAYIIDETSPVAIAVDANLPMPEEIPAAIKILDIEEVSHLLFRGPSGIYAKTRSDDPAYLIFTSGTSGAPKGVLHGHRAVWGRRPMYEGWYGIDDQDIMFHAGAFNWTYTLGTGLFDPWVNGATTIVYTGARSATVWPELIAAYQATLFAAVPSVFRQILKYNQDIRSAVSSLRHGLVAGEPLPVSVADEWQHQTGSKLYEALGMSEISTYISSSPAIGIKPGSPGKPQTGRCVAIIPQTGDPAPLPPNEIGLIGVHISDPGLMLRYWQCDDVRAESFRGDWFCGGDLAMMDEEGYIWFKGRDDDLMNAQGYRVAPAEIEHEILQHNAVSEAAVAEIQVTEALSIIVGFVVLKSDNALKGSDISTFIEPRLATYKCPKQIEIVENLPRTANGKVQRKRLQEVFTLLSSHR